MCSGRRVSASSPACTRGCSVLTRPSRHSGKPVSSSTGVTGTPASAMCCAVDPVETISTPSLCSPCGQLGQPGLVVDARPARGAPARRSSAHGMVTSRPLTVAAVAGQRGDGAHEQPPLLDLDAFVQLVHGVAGPHLDGAPGRAPVRCPRRRRPGAPCSGDLHAVGEGVGDRVRAGEGGQQRRVGVEHRAADPREERRCRGSS